MTKSEALQKAEALATELGKGWAPSVWNNLGWYYSAVKCCMCQVHINSDRSSYTCYTNASKQFIGRGATPTAAYQDSLNQMEAFIKQLQDELNLIHGTKP